MRGSDVQASLYWLGRMLEAGEDPRYIARRMIRFACMVLKHAFGFHGSINWGWASAEDIGLADPNAAVQAMTAYQSCQLIGMPECSTGLAQCAVYLARAPKSNAIEVAYIRVKEAIQKHPAYPGDCILFKM